MRVHDKLIADFANQCLAARGIRSASSAIVRIAGFTTASLAKNRKSIADRGNNRALYTEIQCDRHFPLQAVNSLADSRDLRLTGTGVQRNGDITQSFRELFCLLILDINLALRLCYINRAANIRKHLGGFFRIMLETINFASRVFHSERVDFQRCRLTELFFLLCKLCYLVLCILQFCGNTLQITIIFAGLYRFIIVLLRLCKLVLCLFQVVHILNTTHSIQCFRLAFR